MLIAERAQQLREGDANCENFCFHARRHQAANAPPLVLRVIPMKRLSTMKTTLSPEKRIPFEHGFVQRAASQKKYIYHSIQNLNEAILSTFMVRVKLHLLHPVNRSGA